MSWPSDGLAHWRDKASRTAFLSIAFSWKIDEAKRLSEYYRSLGYRVKAGGPGLFILWPAMVGHAELDLQTDEHGRTHAVGSLTDAVAKHNPLATTASRGCPVKGCAACIVPVMEGREFTLLPDFTPRPILTDNNLSALPADYQQYIVDRYVNAGVSLLDANSGFEPKTFDEEVFERWRPINKGPWRFGLDDTFETSDETVRAPACACCGSTYRDWTDGKPMIQVLQPGVGVWRCVKHRDRNPCAIDGCTRTRAVTGSHGDDQWLCSEHWRRFVPPRSLRRRAYHAFWRKAKRYGWTNELVTQFNRFWDTLIANARTKAEGGTINLAEIERMFGA